MTAIRRSPVVALGATIVLVLAVSVHWIGGGSAAFAASDPVGAPFGNFESARVTERTGATYVQANGWAIDPDTTDPIYVWVTVDGVGSHFRAGAPRPDVDAAYHAGPNHGFPWELAEFGVYVGPGNAYGIEPGDVEGPHTVCVTASNVGPGVHKSLGCRTVHVGGDSPSGNFENARAVPGGIQVKGWALDMDTAGPVYVWVTVDGVGRHLYADQNRPDVDRVFGHGPNHGFLATLAAPPGTHRVCVTAANIGAGSHTSLGCRSVTVPAPSATSPYCGITWGSLAKEGTPGGQSSHTVTDVRTGQHGCYDRLVVDLDGPIEFYSVFYNEGNILNEDGSVLVPIGDLRGEAQLAVYASASSGAGSSYAPTSTRELRNVAGYQTLRQVTLARGSSGATWLGLGVRARLPFRVFTLDGPGAGTRLVIDVAHRW